MSSLSPRDYLVSRAAELREEDERRLQEEAEEALRQHRAELDEMNAIRRPILDQFFGVVFDWKIVKKTLRAVDPEKPHGRSEYFLMYRHEGIVVEVSEEGQIWWHKKFYANVDELARDFEAQTAPQEVAVESKRSLVDEAALRKRYSSLGPDAGPPVPGEAGWGYPDPW